MELSELKLKLNASIDHLKNELSQVRTSRATNSLVEDIAVQAYGANMKIKELGTITTPDAQMIVITPWDKNLIKDIDTAVRNAGLGLNPVPDSQVLKVPIPPLTEDRRKEFVKLVTEKTEVIKNTMRNIRQDAMKDIDRALENKEITEDDKYSAKEEIEAIVKDHVEKIEALEEQKKRELLTV